MGGCGTALGSELTNQPAVSDVFVRLRLACGVKSVLMAALAASRSISSGVTRHCWCTPNTDDVGLYRDMIAAGATDSVQRIHRLLGPAEPLSRARRQLLRAAAAALALTPVLLALTPALVALALGRIPAA